MDQDDGRIPTTRPFDIARPARQRALGVMLGAAVGDALGAPFEFGPADRYRARFPQPVLGGIGEMIGGGGFGWAPGEFTDDTQMAVARSPSASLSRGLRLRRCLEPLACLGVDRRRCRHHHP